MDWKKDYAEGLQFASTAKGMLNKAKVDNETLYNIIALAIEKYTSALASKLNYIPMNSSLVYIFKELSRKTSIPSHFIDEASFMNRFMIYCSLDIVPAKAISKDDVLRMITFMDEVASFTEKHTEECHMVTED